jgi:hypothetical protein
MKKLFFVMALCVASLAYAAEPVFYDARQYEITGSVVKDAENPWNRLPVELKDTLRGELYDLGCNTAGMSVRFSSNTTSIRVKWKSVLKRRMNHMTPTGIRGLDLYMLQDDNTWTFVSSVRPNVNSKNSNYSVVNGMLPKDREYMMYLPLYDGVDSLYIGVDSAATIAAPKVNLPVREKPIVMYGTSILQGGCATRAGMAHTNILQRELNREVINLGFSGNARLDLPIADLMGAIDAGLYVIDVLPNNTTENLKKNIEPFYRALRAANPAVPVLLIESPMFPIYRFCPDVEKALREKNQVLKDFYDKLIAEGVKDVYYMTAEEILGDDVEGTVDNYHFTDKAFRYFADQMLPLIEKYSMK